MLQKDMVLYQHDCDLISDQCIVSASHEANDQHLPQATGYFTILTFRKGFWPVQIAFEAFNNQMYYRITTAQTFAGIAWK